MKVVLRLMCLDVGYNIVIKWLIILFQYRFLYHFGLLLAFLKLLDGKQSASPVDDTRNPRGEE